MSGMAGTDEAWVQWGERDPYFAVITDPKYRSAQLTDTARDEFFATGRWHAKYVLDACRRHVAAGFQPRRALDFGCGVGRVALPLAEQVEQVVGVDISPAMLEEARRNAAARGQGNLSWVRSDDTLSAVEGRFDLVHSCITFQHIDVPRGRVLFARLLELLEPGGAGVIQITYAKARHADTFGQPPAPPPAQKARSLLRSLLPHDGPPRDPEMQMNAYPLGELAYLMQSAGIKGFRADFTDHGGELGLFLFFGKPHPPAASPAA